MRLVILVYSCTYVHGPKPFLVLTSEDIKLRSSRVPSVRARAGTTPARFVNRSVRDALAARVYNNIRVRVHTGCDYLYESYGDFGRIRFISFHSPRPRTIRDPKNYRDWKSRPR